MDKINFVVDSTANIYVSIWSLISTNIQVMHTKRSYHTTVRTLICCSNSSNLQILKFITSLLYPTHLKYIHNCNSNIHVDLLTCVPWLSVVSGFKCFSVQYWAFATYFFVFLIIGTVPLGHSMIFFLSLSPLTWFFGLAKDGSNYSKSKSCKIDTWISIFGTNYIKKNVFGINKNICYCIP